MAPDAAELVVAHHLVARDAERVRDLALLLDGVPGLGPVALPPRCVEDPRRKRHVGVLGRALDKTLMQERGMKRCLGERPVDEGALSEVEKARKWGMDADALKERLKAKAPVGHCCSLGAEWLG